MIRPSLLRPVSFDEGHPFFRTWSAALILLLPLLLARAGFGRTASGPDVPALEDTIPAWLTVRDWLSTGNVPDSDADASRLPLDGLSAVGVLLRLDGRVVGRGFDPQGDAFAVRRAFGRALSQASGDRTIRSLPEPWRSNPGPRLCLEVEFGGPRRPLVGGTLASAARRLRPGLDGIAIVRGENVAIAMPGRLLSTGTADAAGSTLIRLLDEVGLPPRDLPELRRIDSVRLERFETLRLGQSTPAGMPEARSRLGSLVTRVDPDSEDLGSTAATLRDRLVRWPAAPDPSSPDEERPWLGDFDPVSGTHDPLEAPPRDRLLAIWALNRSGTDRIPIPPPTAFDAASITPVTIDLALLAASPGDDVATRAWLERLDDLPASEPDGPQAGLLARRAAALGSLAEDVVGTDRFDEAYGAAWAACGSLPEVLGAFDWLCLAERSWWERHGEPGPRVESLRAVRDSLLARQIDEPTSDLDGSIPLRAGAEEVSDARCLRLLMGMAALAAVPEDDPDRQARANRGIVGLIRFLRQLQVKPDEAADLPDGRRAVGGVQAGPADPRQPLVATAVALIAIDLLQKATP